MRKNEFLSNLRERLSYLPRYEQKEILDYYDEMISDAIDNGENEYDFIDSLGSVEQIINNLKTDESFLEKIKSHSNEYIADVTGLSVKIIGYFILVILGIVVVSIGIGFLSAGIGVIGYAIYRIAFEVANIAEILLMGSMILLGIGFIILSTVFMRWFFRDIKAFLKKLMIQVEEWIRR